MTQEKLAELKAFTDEIRVQTLLQLAARGFGHLGGCMSIVEILSVLYGGELKHDPKNPQWEERDWLVCSKGHAGPAVYSALAIDGFFPVEELKTLNQNGTNLPSHCDRTKTPGIDMTTGSLGQGLSVASGIAMGFKINQKPNRVFVITGDGEMQEGQNWEALLFAGHHHLDNMIVFVDVNKEQLDGTIAELNGLEDYEEKFRSFHWDVRRCDGHDETALTEAIHAAQATPGKPHAIICDTVKGKGVNWAEGHFTHHINVSMAQAEEAIAAIRGQ